MIDSRKTEREIVVSLSDDSEITASISIELHSYDHDSVAPLRLNSLDMRMLNEEIHEVISKFVTGGKTIYRGAVNQND
jgi:hypothetical protein